jgi:hypothetical protein
VLRLSVVELSGDTEPSPQELDAADLICTTPEKFDAITRKYKEFGNARFFGEVRCLPACLPALCCGRHHRAHHHHHTHCAAACLPACRWRSC